MRYTFIRAYSRHCVCIGRVYRNDARSGRRHQVISVTPGRRVTIRGLHIRGWGIAVATFPPKSAQGETTP